jgi:hypothetical protein
LKKVLFLILAIVCTLVAPITVTAQESVSGAGGTLTAPTTVNSNIVVTGVQLTNGGTASFSCPVTFFGAGTYQWNWQCAGGKLTVDGEVVASLSGTMTLNCSGGGRAHPTTCWHMFSGIATAPDKSTGAVSVSAKGSTGGAPGTVTAFSSAW